MSVGGIHEQVFSAVKQCLDQDANGSGAVLYNGWSSLRPGLLYLMGLNPGGNSEKIGETVLQSIDPWKENYSSYTDECWNRTHPATCDLIECRGESRHQRGVRALVDTFCLEIGIKDVFAANAIFARTTDQYSLRGPCELWDKCWPVHRLFLSIVQPKLILCLGNGDRLSAFSLLRSRFSGAPIVQYCGRQDFRDGKWFAGKVAVGQKELQELECMVVGIPHPSRYVVTRRLQDYLEQLRDRLAG